MKYPSQYLQLVTDFVDRVEDRVLQVLDGPSLLDRAQRAERQRDDLIELYAQLLTDLRHEHNIAPGPYFPSSDWWIQGTLSKVMVEKDKERRAAS